MRWYYTSTISEFHEADNERILGTLITACRADTEQTQIDAWQQQIKVLKNQLSGFVGKIFFEFTIPRIGRRVDVVVLLSDLVVLLEFKVGEKVFKAAAIDQVWDYALDLKNFHKTSHNAVLLPVLVATKAHQQPFRFKESTQADGVIEPIAVNPDQIQSLLDAALTARFPGVSSVSEWERGEYLPTPTIVEAALALYGGHNVEDIVRRDADATNLAQTVNTLQGIIQNAKQQGLKAICFVTGVPGAGKTLVGLDIAVKNIDSSKDLYSVYLSGNGPLVEVLREALARDKVSTARAAGAFVRKKDARSKVELFIQNVHRFRDDCIALGDKPPIEHVVIFDESQRAWTREMTTDFMQRKKGIQEFYMSEPEFLISCMNKHTDWSVVICLVGGGQEINRGEAGISEWISAVERAFPNWAVYCSPQLMGENYIPIDHYSRAKDCLLVHEDDSLHLATSMRSFRASQLSAMINAILALDAEFAKSTYDQIRERYPIRITRNVEKGRQWVRKMARGSQRYGMVVSSKAYRLRPHAVDVRVPGDPVHWFLGKEDVRSSYYLEDVATEFQIQGLGLDWVCVTWDADLRHAGNSWSHHNFVGTKWQSIQKQENQRYLENAYRVLMTRARLGMVLVVPEGSDADPTRQSNFYDPTYAYLKSMGIPDVD